VIELESAYRYTIRISAYDGILVFVEWACILGRVLWADYDIMSLYMLEGCSTDCIGKESLLCHQPGNRCDELSGPGAESSGANCQYMVGMFDKLSNSDLDDERGSELAEADHDGLEWMKGHAWDVRQ
jgi:hypothetical protein